MSRKLDTEEIIRISTDEFKQTKKIPLVVVLDNVRSMHNIGSVFRTSDAYVVEKVVLCGITAQPPHPDIHKSALGAEFSVDWEYYADTNEAVAALKAQGYEVWAIELAENSVMLQDFFNHHTDSHPNSEGNTENEDTNILSPSLRGTKIANPREQSQARLSYAEQEQFGQSQPKSGGGSQLSTLNSQLSTKYAVVLGNEVKGVQQSVIDQCEGCIELPQFGTKHSLNVSVTAGIVIWEFFKTLKI